MSIPTPRPAWKFVAGWSLATVAGFVVGMLGAIVLSYPVVNLFYPKETNLIVGLCVGAGVGAGQIIAARPWLRLAKSWMWGAAVVMGPPFIATVVLRELGWELDAAPARVSLATVALAGGRWVHGSRRGR